MASKFVMGAATPSGGGTILDTSYLDTLAMRVEHFSGNRFEFVVECLSAWIPGRETMKIIDVGAGGSEMTALLASKNLLGDLEQYDKLPRSTAVRKCDIERDTLPTDYADVVLLIECLEHLWNPGKSVETIAATLKTGGKLILTTPNPAWSKSRIRFLVHDTISCFTDHDLACNHHVFTPWVHVVKRLMEIHGLAVERHVTLESRLKLPNRPLSLSYPFRLLGWTAAKLIEAREPAAMGMSYALVATKLG
jgi:SAM-dependent methyltransferase